MKLKSIEINGFKSFADKVKLDFETNITAIIGPNGSGKSNVSDAVRWVLGEQSAKTLRGSKMEDVIFSGTDEKLKKNYATVSITFDNSDNVIPVDFKEVTVSRRLYRTGESEYSINKSNVRLKEIKELFLDTGIGREGYSIIGQGRIEEIINGKSEDRRMIFEEASGISKIKYQKNESQKKLLRTKDNLTRLRDIIIQNEQRCEFLKTQSDKAKKGLKLLDSIERAEFSISYKDYNNYNVNIEKYNNTLNGIKEEYNDVSKEIEELKSKLNPLKEKLSEVTAIVELSNREYSNSCLKKNEFINKREILSERNKFIEENKKNISSSNYEYKLELEKISKDIEKIENEIKEKSVFRKDFFSNRNNIKSELEEKNNLLKEKLLVLNNIKLEKIKLEEDINLLETEKKANDIVKENIEKKITENEREVLKLNLDLKNLDKKIEFLEKKLGEEKNSLSNITLNISNLSDKNINFNDEINILKNENININSEIAYKNKEISMIKNYIRNYEGYNKSVQDLFKLAEKETKLKAMICGTLGELIYVDEKYKKAIDTVLSSNLQGIVVNDEKEAKLIIERIKENKIGRLNFFPISKIFSKTEIFNIKDDHILVFGNEVINCNEKYRNIVNYFLSKTVICENLDIAIEISKRYKNKFRIVTLDGDIISNWGSISGGYKSNKNSFSVIGRKKQLEILLSEIENLKNIFDKNIFKISELEQNLVLNKNEILNLENNKQKISSEITELDRKIYKSKLEIEQILNKVSEIKSYENNHIGFTSEKERELEDKKISILVFNSELEKIQNELDLIKDIIYSLEKKEIIAINDLDSIERDINILSNSKNELIENESSIKNKLNIKNNELDNFDLQFNQNLKEIDSINEFLKELEIKITNLSLIIDENTKLKENLVLESEKFSNRFSALNESFFVLEKEIEKNELRLVNVKSQLENLISRLSDEYSINDEEISKKMEIFKDEKYTKEELKRFKDSLRNLGSFSYDSIEEYEKVSSELEFQKNQEIDLKNSVNDINHIITKLESTMKKTFLDEFKNINEKFSSIFKILFAGGEARLELDSDDILTCGIDIIAKPVGKKMQTLSLLSGGEKALTAVALLFAIFETRPSPFCILDEIDAALDDSNILRYIEYLKSFLVETQFIMITHRKPTMEMADMIYGVTMEKKGISKIVSIKFNDKE